MATSSSSCGSRSGRRLPCREHIQDSQRTYKTVIQHTRQSENIQDSQRTYKTVREHTRQPSPDSGFGLRVKVLKTFDRLRVGREGYHESRRCSRDTYPESYITKYTSIRRRRYCLFAEKRPGPDGGCPASRAQRVCSKFAQQRGWGITSPGR